MSTTFNRFFDPIPAPGNIYAAYALAVLETAAYRNDPALIEEWARIMGLPIFGLIETPDRFTPNIAYAGTATRMVVAVPGTTSPGQMLNNILYSAQRVNNDFTPFRVHSFFLWCAEGIAAAIQDRLDDLPDLAEVCFVGHSLGGAVAQILGDWAIQSDVARTRYVCTFNSPRVGDIGFSEFTSNYPTHNYYATHDMVTELPPNVLPSSTAYQTYQGVVDVFQHRDDLIPLKSFQDIRESWMAVGVGKIVYPVKWGLSWLGLAESAAPLIRGLGWVGSRALWASYALPVPAWVTQHFMTSILENIEAITTFTGMPEHQQLKIMSDALKALTWPWLVPTEAPFALAPPAAFARGVEPGGGDPADLPAIAAGTRVETIEAAFTWMTAAQLAPVVGLINGDDSFVEALTRRAVEVAPASPLAAPGTTAARVDAAPHHYFRGRDRRLLQKIAKCFALLEARDFRAVDPAPTASISTREIVFDWLDDDLRDALEGVEARVTALLALTRDAPWLD